MKIKIIATLALALGIVAISATAASAHIKSADISCDTASVSLTYYDQGATALIVLDGVMKQGLHGTDGDVGTGFGGNYSQSWPLTSDAAHTSHRLQVTVISTDGAQYNLNYDQTVTGCYTPPPVDVCNNIEGNQETIPEGYISDGNGGCVLPPPPPVDLCSNIDGVQTSIPDGMIQDGTTCVTTVVLPEGSFTPATCDAGASYTLPVLPDTAKYVLNPDGSRPVAGTFALGAGQSVTVTAHTLASANVVQVSKTYGPFTGSDAIPAQSTDADAPCYVPPVVTPTPTPEPTVPVTPVTPVTPTADKTLATTGSDPTVPLGIAALLLALGLTFTTVKLIKRRREV